MEHSAEVNKAKYWHGGAPGLLVGDHIIPRSELPLENYDRLMEHSYDPTDLGRVYITTDRDFALGWAIRYGNMPYPGARIGALYEVRPVGTLVPDPDFPPEAGSWITTSALILAVDKRRVKGRVRTSNQLIYQYARWTDNTPVYTPSGHLTVSPAWAEHGVTEDDLRPFGRWVSMGTIGFDPMQRCMREVPVDEAEQRELFDYFHQQPPEERRRLAAGYLAHRNT